jgi:hypothetical protein
MQSNNTLVIANTPVRQDAEGRYCLNDLHRASGGDNKNKPNIWTANQQTKDLVAEVEIAGNPAIVSRQKLGTYACKELVYAYAMWISPKFHLAVIRAYDSLVSVKKEDNALPMLDAQLLFVEKASSILRCSETSKIRLLANVASNNGLPSNLLPHYTDEQLTRALGDLLKENGSPYSARSMNPILCRMGYLEKLTRRSKGKDWKEFWSITEAGLGYGKNETSTASPNETQPRWYVDKFPELLREISEFMFGKAA